MYRQMQKELDGFEAWYKHTFSGRVLTWRHQHTSVTMTAKFPGGNKEIGVSLFQASVLQQFNGSDTLTFEEIFAQTGIGESPWSPCKGLLRSDLGNPCHVRTRGACSNTAVALRYEGHPSLDQTTAW